MPGVMPPRPPTGLYTESTPTKVQAANPVKAGYDPLKWWAKWTHQMGYVAPRRYDAIRQARESLLPSVKV